MFHFHDDLIHEHSTADNSFDDDPCCLANFASLMCQFKFRASILSHFGQLVRVAEHS